MNLMKISLILLFILPLIFSQNPKMETFRRSKAAISQLVLDTQGKEDVLNALPLDLREVAFSSDPTQGNPKEFLMILADRLAGLFLHQISIEIIVVGLPDGQKLQSYLEATPPSYVNVLNDKNQHFMPIRKEYIFTVRKPSANFEDNLKKNLDNEMLNLKIKNRIPVEIMDNIIYNDYKGYEDDSIYRIYILNTGFPMGSYIYTQQGSESCETNMGVGLSKRYMWIDLVAGPVSWGYNSLGQGIISNLNFPNPGIFDPNYRSNEPIEHVITEFWRSVSSLVQRTTDLMIAPPVDHLRVSATPSRTILLILIHDKNENEKRAELFQWGPFIKQLQTLPLSSLGQTLETPLIEVSLTSCAPCYSLYMRALRSYTSTINIGGNLRTSVVNYLDSELLRHELRNSYYEFFLGNYTESFLKGAESDFYPIFLFDLNSEQPLLLDRQHQSIGWTDMAIAVETSPNLGSSNSKIPTNFVCNKKNIMLQTNDAFQSIMDSVIKGIWGISPVSQIYDSATKSNRIDLLWSLHDYPFKQSPLSFNQRSLSFREYDAVIRNQIYYDVYQNLFDLHKLFTKFITFQAELSEAMTREEYQAFIQRWNLFTYKMDQTKAQIALLHHESAFYYLESMKFDLNAMSEIIQTASSRFVSSLKCKEDNSLVNARAVAILSTVIITITFIVGVLRNSKNI